MMTSNIELLNCAEEAGMVRTRLNAEQAEVIAGALAQGKFVVVREVPHYCKSTDACVGNVRYFERCFNDRAAAESWCDKEDDLDDSRLFVFPALPTNPVAPALAEDCPF
jgi:hypothetical protein